jgi:hypothetical protein
MAHGVGELHGEAAGNEAHVNGARED